jgi:glutamyl-tRNA synthetase
MRLPTLRALRRRGIKPEAIEEFVLKQGFSKAEAKPSMEILEAINRKLVDSKAKRYFFVPDPVKLIVKNAPEITAKIRSHPTQDLGTREVKTKGTFYVDKNDVKESEEIRLKELYNVFIDKIEDKTAYATFSSMEMKGKGKKIQWVTEDHLKTRVIRSHGLLKDNELIPLEITDGLLEREGEKIKEGEIVQFERFGFCRKNEGMFCFTHR